MTCAKQYLSGVRLHPGFRLTELTFYSADGKKEAGASPPVEKGKSICSTQLLPFWQRKSNQSLRCKLTLSRASLSSCLPQKEVLLPTGCPSKAAQSQKSELRAGRQIKIQLCIKIQRKLLAPPTLATARTGESEQVFDIFLPQIPVLSTNNATMSTTDRKRRSEISPPPPPKTTVSSSRGSEMVSTFWCLQLFGYFFY